MKKRLVYCNRLQREAPGLDGPPFAGKVGKEIFERVSQEAFEAWKEVLVKTINEYRLDLSEASHREKLFQRMRSFLKLDNEVHD